MTAEIANRVLALTSTFVKGGVELDVDLVGSGIMDSLAFLELVVALESEFNVELDFAELDPERFTTPRGLIEALEASCNAHASLATASPDAPGNEGSGLNGAR